MIWFYLNYLPLKTGDLNSWFCVGKWKSNALLLADELKLVKMRTGSTPFFLYSMRL